MKHLVNILLLGFLISCGYQDKPDLDSSAETIDISDSFDQIELPNEQYSIYNYDSTLHTEILTYRYSDLWDIDDDGKLDVISFIGNGGAHEYFHLQIELSSQPNNVFKYSTFQIDMPYYDEKDNVNSVDDELSQFVVSDFDGDEVNEIYLNIDNPFGSIPTELQLEGLTSKRILIDFFEGELRLLNYTE